MYSHVSEIMCVAGVLYSWLYVLDFIEIWHDTVFLCNWLYSNSVIILQDKPKEWFSYVLSLGTTFYLHLLTQFVFPNTK